ncbi:MFS transporter [Bifidobacterium callimiconis]|uniref:MFS transporter n=1 Tax=Bifidobacterium callimiconis TaxID=2306973 RepID=UPI001BDC6162|nr:MFS transporter [Bifidobacterium callimiconis]MBT1177086.1 MFS transporter [Bifidobacterium callimiconis]
MEEKTVAIGDDIAPDTGKPMPKSQMIRFAAGFIIFNIMWMMAGSAGSSVLLPNRFNDLNIGMTPEAILASMNSIGIIFALISNVVFGALSDATHGKLGKRTPWIIPGGIIAGIGYYMTSVAVTLTGIVAWWSVLQIGLNMMIAPCVAILSDRIPQKIRGTLSAFYGVGQIVGQSLGAIIGAAFVTNPRPGFLVGVVIWVLTGIVTIIILPKELPAVAKEGESFSVKQIVMQFRPPVRGARDFYLALVGRLLMIFGYNMIMGYQLYVCQKYIGLSTTDAAATVSTMATIVMVVSLIFALAGGPISDKLGKRKLPVFVASAIMSIGLVVPWLAPTRTSMLIFSAIMAVGYGIYMAVDQALNVDVLPNPDDAGKDLGILNLANTLGQVIAPIVTSSIVIATGSYALAFPSAIAAVMAGAVIILFIKKAK